MRNHFITLKTQSLSRFIIPLFKAAFSISNACFHSNNILFISSLYGIISNIPTLHL
ncbi:MAG: hypothetical protein WCG25_02945 [bacterium]